MELKEFVQSAIGQVIQGVQASFPVALEAGAFVAGNNSTEIEFDVAVTTSETSKSEGEGRAKAEIKVWGFGSIGGGVGGTKASESTHSHVSRIKFVVQVSLPQDPTKVQERQEKKAAANAEATAKMRQAGENARRLNSR